MRMVWIVWGICLLWSSSFSTLQADELGARIRGTVTDPSHAAIAGAEVQATNSETQISKTALTSEDGSFQFLALPVGSYDVTVTKSGFRTYRAMRVQLVLNQVYELTVPLVIGLVTESVQVQANPLQVETAVTQLGTVRSGDQITNPPSLNRNWAGLQQLGAGPAGQSDRFSTAFATNGSQSQHNSYLINGSDSNDIRVNTLLVLPNPDALAEFNVITSTINAEYGRNSGAILNAIIKSGTNQFRGNAFEFYRDTFLNARSFFQRTAPIFHQNQYGGTLGGPVRKNRTFFFISYQGTRNRSPDSNSFGPTTVFTDDQRNGIFPEVARSSTPSPFPMVGENGATYAAGTPYSVLFPTGRIPAADFNPTSRRLLDTYVPKANLGDRLYSFNPTQITNVEQGLARIDHTFGPADSLWAWLYVQDAPVVHAVSFVGSNLPGFGEVDSANTKQFAAAWNHIFSPTTVNEFRAAYTRLDAKVVTPLNPALPSSFGFAGITPQYPETAGGPYISLSGFFSLGFSPFGPTSSTDNTYQLDDNFSKIVGRHTLKFGFSGRRYDVVNPYQAFNSGQFSFVGAGRFSTGNPGADFLLGIPDSFKQQSGGLQNFRTYTHYLYAQDSWRVNNNLTLNYGVGYQIDTPYVNQLYDRLDKNCFRPGQQSTVFPTAPAGLLFPGDKGCSESGYYNHYDHFAPRFGFAYAPDWGSISGGRNKKFVIRGGFGVYFNRTEEELALQDLFAAPFSIQSSGAGNPGFTNPYVDIATRQPALNPFPFTPPKRGQAVDFSRYYPLSINVVDPNFTSPYVMNFNLNIQRELPGSMILQLAYVGSQGRHLQLVSEGNPISPAGATACAADPACIQRRTKQHALYPDHALYAPGNIFASVGTQSTRGVSSYNSLQLTLNKRFGQGLTFLLAYALSHSIDIGSGYEDSGTSGSGVNRSVNPYNFALSRGDSSFDTRHRLALSYDYALPRLSKRWNNAFSRYATDGWRLSGITILQTGFPITVGDGSLNSLTCDQDVFYRCWDAPNVNGPVNTYDPRNTTLVNTTRNPANKTALPNYYFEPNAFSSEAVGTLGNAGRNNFHGPGVNNTDLALIKEVNLSETRKIELRLESFNVFNHTQFRFSGNIRAFQDINNSSSFGRTLTAAPGRIVQLGAKFYF